MRKIFALFVLAGLTAVIFLSAPVTTTQAKKDKLRKSANKIQNSYIVVLDDQVVGERGLMSIAPYIASELATSHRGRVTNIYQHALNGFAVNMSEADAEALSQDFRVKFVEEDSVVTADATQTNPPDRKSTRLNSSHSQISYAVFCLKKKKKKKKQ